MKRTRPHSPPGSLEERLRSGARAFAPAPPPELRGRILAALRASPRPSLPLGPVTPREVTARTARHGNALAAAAAVLVLASAWWLTRSGPAPAARAPAVVALSRDLLGAGSRVLSLPAAAGDNLRREAERLMADTARLANGVVRGLPGPLRTRLERM